MYYYTSKVNYTAMAIETARRLMQIEPNETPEGAAARAIRTLRHGDRVRLADVVKAIKPRSCDYHAGRFDAGCIDCAETEQ